MGQDPVRAEPVSKQEKQQLQTRSVLVVADGSRAAQLERLLRACDDRSWTQTRAADPEDARACLAREHPDVVICDLVTGGIEDSEAFSSLVAECPDVPFVVLASDASGPATEEYYEQGAQECLAHKELNGAVLNRTLTGAIARHRAVRRDIQSLVQEVKSRRESIRVLVTRKTDAIVIVDLDGNVLYLNPASEKLIGRPASELIGQRAEFPLVPGETRELRLLRNDEAETIAELDVVNMEWEGSPGMLASLRDVTDQRRVEKTCAQLEEELRLQRRQRVESLEILAGGIAHDFNNILAIIMGNTDMALLDWEQFSDEPDPEHLTHIKNASRRAADLVAQMMAYAGRTALDIHPLDLQEIIEAMETLLRSSISKKAHIEFQLGQDLPLIRADATQIKQILLNLITNASEALGEQDGTISLTSGVLDATAAYLAECASDDTVQPGRFVFLEVADTGEGLTPEVRSKLFDPFFSTRFTGRGLGLAAVLGIVRAHGGAIRVDTNPGVGSCFRVLFPAAAAVPTPIRPSQPSLAGWRGTGTILIVDDEVELREMTAAMVEKSGFQVMMAADGEEAVQAYRDQGSSIRVVILDMTMPKMDGLEAFDVLKEIDPKVPVIICSGYTEEEVRSRFGSGGPSHFLQKPFDRLQLIGKLKQMLDDRSN